MENPLIRTLLRWPNFKDAISIRIWVKRTEIEYLDEVALTFQTAVRKRYANGETYHNRTYSQADSVYVSLKQQAQFKDFVFAHALACQSRVNDGCVLYIHRWYDDPEVMVASDRPSLQRRNVLT